MSLAESELEFSPPTPCTTMSLSETEFASDLYSDSFNPNLWIDISDFIDKKIEIMEIYKSEIKEPPFPRSEDNIRALATYRGSTVGSISAESFIQIKEII